MNSNNIPFGQFILAGIILSAIIYLISCEKETDKPTGDNKVVLTTTTAGSPGYFNVNVTSSITQTGGQTLTDHGFCYDTTPNPDINATIKSLGKRTEPGDFSAELTNLEDNKKYYIRAFATFSGGTLYTGQKEINTLKTGKPDVKADSVFSINTNTALFRGTVVSDSGLIVIARGACWNTTPNPLISDSHTIDDDGTGTFLSTITGLNPGVTYHVRAYATNDKGTTYGNTLIFNAKVDLPELSTTPVSSVTPTTAMSGGVILSDGGGSITSRGVCWNTSPSPTILNSLTIDGSGTGTFISSLTNLIPGTTYYVRAYSNNNAGTAYGNSQTFTALATLPTINTSAITNITSTTATGGGNVVSEGGADVTARGVCWSTFSNPTISDLHTSNGSGAGSFTSSINGLTPGSTYYVRAYATNSQGTSYGNQENFRAGISLANVITSIATNITQTSAISGGTILSDSGGAISSRGVCWNTTPTPSILNSLTIDGSGTGTFISNLTNLTPGTTYYVRAYAINDAGTAYGNSQIFTSLATLPTITTNAITNITSTTATGGGNVISDGGAPVITRGVCWSTSDNPTTSDFHTSNGSGTGSFTSSLTGLTPGSTYYVRAYATNSQGTSYGNPENFTAGAILPTVSTTAATNITQTTATSGGNVTSDGGVNVTVRGVCWSTSSNPTITNAHTNDGSGTGTFTSNLTGLTANTLYHIRAYATNSAGTSYGNDLTFTTLANPVAPTVTTTEATNITQTTATSGGNVTSDGGATVTARGVCWSTSSNPTIANTHTTNGSGTGTFTSNLIGLTANTLYYIRAYATNSAGTSYGNDLTFTTLANPVAPTVTTTEATNITQTTATSGGNVTSDGGANVTARGVCWSTSSNPTIANTHTTNGSGTGTFTSELNGLTANTLYHIRAYATNSAGTSYGSDLEFTTNAQCLNFTLTHTAGSIAPVTKTVTYSTAETNLTGEYKCWITQNLGADHQATAATDATEASAGWYWQFNRKQGYKHDGTTRTPNTTWITAITENSDWLPANDPCTLLLGSGWRLPTYFEWTNADATGGWDNYNETFASLLKLHAAGYLYFIDGPLGFRGSNGNYWSSSQGSSSYGCNLFFTGGNSNMENFPKASGLSVRCLRD